MDFKEILTNQAVVYGGVGVLMLIIGMVFTRKKRAAVGLSLSKLLRKWIGKSNEAKVEQIIDDIVEGMKSDNVDDETKVIDIKGKK